MTRVMGQGAAGVGSGSRAVIVTDVEAAGAVEALVTAPLGVAAIVTVFGATAPVEMGLDVLADAVAATATGVVAAAGAAAVSTAVPLLGTLCSRLELTGEGVVLAEVASAAAGAGARLAPPSLSELDAMACDSHNCVLKSAGWPASSTFLGWDCGVIFPRNPLRELSEESTRIRSPGFE